MRIRLAISLGLSTLLCASWVNAAQHTAIVTYLQGLSLNQDCYYFILSGVPVADPAIPGSPWFAVARAQFGSRDAYALLLAAKISDVPVRVHTTGAAICGGYAQVAEVSMP